MSNILILGKTGMLGSMLYYYFSNQPGYHVFTTSREIPQNNPETNLFFDIEKTSINELKNFILKNQIEYVINATGLIRQKYNGFPNFVEQSILINSSFPYKLSKLSKELDLKVIQIATDCVFDGQKGKYPEGFSHNATDVYGKTKSLGEVNDGTILNIRCSIVGPELKSKVSLLEWFLNQPSESEIKGFTHHRWNGVTTLRFAKLVDQIIRNKLYSKLIKKSSLFHFVPKYSLTKYEMLKIFKEVFNKNIQIISTDMPKPDIDRTLSTIFDDLTPFSCFEFREDIQRLKDVMEKDFYK